MQGIRFLAINPFLIIFLSTFFIFLPFSPHFHHRFRYSSLLLPYRFPGRGGVLEIVSIR